MLLNKAAGPSEDGILSTQIFGTSTKKRRETFAYIDLNCHVFQPLVYKTLKRVDRHIVDIVAGTKNFSISKSGELVEDENGNTGLEWLYKNWEKVKFKKNNSDVRTERIKFIENSKKDELFQSRELVIPAFYRDINIHNDGEQATHVINQYYTKLIRLADMFNQGDFTFNMNYTRMQIQNLVVTIYDELKSKLEKKRGLLKQAIMAKNTDYGARLIISSAKVTANKQSDMMVDFFHAGIPLSYCVSCFTPFFTGWIQDYFKSEFEMTGFKLPYYSAATKSFTSVQVKDPTIQFSDDAVHKLMKTFIYSPQQRFDPLYVETEDKKHPKIPLMFKGRYMEESNDGEKVTENPNNQIANRPFTLTDLFYLAAHDICSNKHVYITRYPITDYLGIFPCGIAILTTADTVKMQVNGKEYPFYPKIDMKLPKEQIPTQFIEVVTMQNTYLQAMNGDYDGDQITVKGVFSEEANLEAEKIMRSPSNLMSINGSPNRTTTIEAIQTCYSISKWNNPDEYFIKGKKLK